MTQFLEFNRKLIFYRPGILRYAMRQAERQLGAPQSPAQRQQLLSDTLKRRWAAAKAQLAALQWLQALADERGEHLQNTRPSKPQNGDSGWRTHNRADGGKLAPPADLAIHQLH